MNKSQANLYEILDAFGIAAKVGKDTFDIPKSLPFNNGIIDVNLKIEGLYIYECLGTTMYALMRIGDLGILAKAKDCAFAKVMLLNLADPVAKFYIDSEDYPALMNHMNQDKWKSDFIVESFEYE